MPERTSINYEYLQPFQLVEMLKRRGVRMAEQGPKATKIERLRLNDQMHRETGPSGEGGLYGRTSAYEDLYHNAIKHQKQTSEYTSAQNPYTTMNPKRISTLLAKRNLDPGGTPKQQIRRLLTHDRQTAAREQKTRHKGYEKIKADLESQTGQAIASAEACMQHETELDALDIEIQARGKQTRKPVPKCEYDWKTSHWASRTERELSEICRRREMPGSGTRAAMIKWLETGFLEYEDVTLGSLERICEERGVRFKSDARKSDLVKLLVDADEAEEAG